MDEKIKLTGDELSLMSLFESLTDVFPISCKIYENNVFFIIDKKDMPRLLANGLKLLDNLRGHIPDKRAILNALVNELSKSMGKYIHLAFLDDDLETFLRNFFMLGDDDIVRIKVNKDGSKYVIINVNPARRGRVIGKRGIKAKVARELARMFYNVRGILIK